MLPLATFKNLKLVDKEEFFKSCYIVKVLIERIEGILNKERKFNVTNHIFVYNKNILLQLILLKIAKLNLCCYQFSPYFFEGFRNGQVDKCKGY